MPPLSWRTRTLVWALFAAIVSLANCADAGPANNVETLLTPCKPDEGPGDALCGKIQVYEDREAQQGPQIDLNVLVLPALERNAAPDPLFVLTGGPGTGAASLAPMLRVAFDKVQQYRDLVFVDQRGTGKSNRLACDWDEEELEALADVAFPEEQLRACLEGLDANPALYTTPIGMDDLNEVREKLGYGQINLWGGSYGTRAALVYLRRHPETVRAVILDGVAPPNMKLPLAMAADGHRAMQMLIDACEATEDCHEQFPEVRQKLDEVLARLDRAPARVDIPHPRTGETEEVTIRREVFASILRGATYDAGVASIIPMVIEQAHAGNFQGLIAMASLNERITDLMSLGMFFSVVCAEDVPFITEEENERAAEGTYLGGFMLPAWKQACEIWPRGAVPENYHEPVSSGVPVLILSGDLDPVTPPGWGEEIAEHLPNSRHMVVPGVGHGTLATGCVPQLMADFLEQGAADDLDASCVEKHKRPPFFVTNAGPTPGPIKEEDP